MRGSIFTLLLVFGLPYSQAFAQTGEKSPVTTQDLYRACQAPQGRTDYGFCLGYIVAAGNLMALNSIQGPNKFTICPADRRPPSGEAMIQAFSNWAQAHPQEWSDDSLIGLTLALQATWPCPKPN
jgi:hypothetical protein